MTNTTTATAITINITGQLTLDAQSLQQLISCLQIQAPTIAAPPSPPQFPAVEPKLVYTVPETAKILGISPGSVYRLLVRGQLRSSGGLRVKRITHAEIERFLKMTTGY